MSWRDQKSDVGNEEDIREIKCFAGSDNNLTKKPFEKKWGRWSKKKKIVICGNVDKGTAKWILSSQNWKVKAL